MLKLESVRLAGYKSFDGSGGGQSVRFGDTTVLIGANGAGKSNIVSAFRLLCHAMAGGLQSYVSKADPTSFFFGGVKRTPTMEMAFAFKDEAPAISGNDRHETICEYALRFDFGNPDRLLVTSETLSYKQFAPAIEAHTHALAHDSSGELALWRVGCEQAGLHPHLIDFLSRIRAYQFHDTSDGASIKLPSSPRSPFLMSDGGNLASVLLSLKQRNERHYERIRRHVRRVMPQFDDFFLEPLASGNVLLNWRARGNPDMVYGPHQLSDGTLRFMALAVLLLQPAERMPSVIVIDEPELGLHPAGIRELAGMIRTAAQAVQVIIATQSPLLVNEFDPEQIVVVEQNERTQGTVCRALDAERLADWLEDYSLGDLWEKNLFGGRP